MADRETRWTVYLPVAVDLDAEGHIIGATIDYDGAPWMSTLDEPNIWDDAAGEWVGSAGNDQLAAIEEEAVDFVGGRTHSRTVPKPR